MRTAPATLILLATLSTVGGVAMAQSSGPAAKPSRAVPASTPTGTSTGTPAGAKTGPKHGDTSAQATPARARPATPIAPRPSAKLTSPANANRAVLIPVTANTQDASSASTSLSTEPLDLRQPMRFDRVFALSREPGDLKGGTLLNFGGSRVAASSVPLDTSKTQWFARVDGGILALFPRSVYTETSQGTMAEVPAGTVFAIGHPPAHYLSEEAKALPTPSLQDVLDSRPIAARAGQNAQGARPVLSRSADGASDGATSDEAKGAMVPLPTSVFRNDEYRAKRVRGLLLQAASGAAEQRTGEARTSR